MTDDNKVISMEFRRNKKAPDNRQQQLQFQEATTTIGITHKWCPIIVTKPPEGMMYFDIEMEIDFTSILPAPFSVMIQVVHESLWVVHPVYHEYKKLDSFVYNTETKVYRASIQIKEYIDHRWRTDRYMIAAMVKSDDVTAEAKLTVKKVDYLPNDQTEV